MDVSALRSLGDRWPRDRISEPSGTDVGDFTRLFTTPTGHSYYESRFVIDLEDSASIEAFVTTNRLEYRRKPRFDPLVYGAHTPGWLGRQIGTTMPLFAHEVSGKFFGFEVEIFLAYTPQSDGLPVNMTNDPNYADGKRPDTKLYRRSVVRVRLPTPFPQLVLDSKVNDRAYISSISGTFAADQRISLEGYFGKYFDFYAPKGLQINALTVLAPNFMQTLIGSSTTFDVEFFGSEVFFISADPVYTAKTMPVALTALEIQLKYIDRLLTSWNYTPLSIPFDHLKPAVWGGQTYRVGNLKLSPGRLVILALAGIILVPIIGIVLPYIILSIIAFVVGP